MRQSEVKNCGNITAFHDTSGNWHHQVDKTCNDTHKRLDTKAGEKKGSGLTSHYLQYYPSIAFHTYNTSLSD